ncbi:MAG: SDR family oxidoreductase [Sphingomonadales bacterium]|nr:MAG: SDR family oxidoreductase [Sphingomonadales bacterium]
MTDLKGQNIVITGSGGGLGAAYAKAAAALGAKIVVNDINADNAQGVVEEIRSAGGSAVAAVGNIVDPAFAEAMIQRCISEFGSITDLVNNAGVFATEPIWAASLDKLKLALDVNVVGTFNCARAAVGPMIAQGFGNIVNITSGAHLGMPEHGSYGASKGAVSSFTYGWAVDLADKGVRVNCLSPMAFTPMAAHLPHLPPVGVNVPPLLFLLSKRSKNLNGQVIRIVDKKLSIMAHPANRAPVLERDEWTLDTVGDAFDETLGALVVPTGIATYEISKVS